ncbi:TetR/AcrR family transcriptional regulator [Neorhizobium lilium]|uniref:TetR/AcrR family transcriptional regulator n=1 Tax=Neorhizobium lilium TaxID=2503024 RepID=A0A3S3VQ57_9HYPH|nr:TetR/AcrR family transcriptional regulator [Neorhizobium lilium]RWX81549.1 TetR/AcrR family transcriptional regulator [Neorhizobium lilium]
MEGTDARSRLIEAATSEFLARGYEQANVGRIATAAGISKKTVYKHFNSKVDLLHAVMNASMAPTLVSLGPLDLDVPPRERLAAHLHAFAELAFSTRGITSYRLFMSEGARFAEMANLYIAAIAMFGIEPLARDLQAYVAAKKLSLNDPVLAARMLMSMVFAEPMRDAGLGVAKPPTADEAKTLIEAAVTLFLQGASPKTATTPQRSFAD